MSTFEDCVFLLDNVSSIFNRKYNVDHQLPDTASTHSDSHDPSRKIFVSLDQLHVEQHCAGNEEYHQDAYCTQSTSDSDWETVYGSDLGGRHESLPSDLPKY